MTDATSSGKRSLFVQDARTKRRASAEKRFRAYGIAAIATGLFFLVVLIASIVWNGIPAFTQTYITVQVELVEEKLDKSGTRDLVVMKKVSTFGYAPLIDGLPILRPYDPETDLVFYEARGDLFEVAAGGFAIFAPQDIHAPGLAAGDPPTCGEVLKVVVKCRLVPV